MSEKTVNAAKIALDDCLAAKPGEKLFLLTDDGKLDLCREFFTAAKELGLEVAMMSIPVQQGGEMPELAAEALLRADCALMITTYSFTHTHARARATERGVRMASMPTLTHALVETTLNADYKEIGRITGILAQKLNKASSVHITTALGTDLTLSLAGREAEADTGVLGAPGAFGNLPAGEACISPVETKGDGVLVVDGVITGLRIVEEPLTLTFRDGRIVDIQGAMAQEFKDFVERYDDKAVQVAEFGIGTNPGCKIMGNPLCDEKIFGTVHVACGNNLFMGGQQDSSIHYDMIVNAPTVFLDDECIIRGGKHIY